MKRFLAAGLAVVAGPIHLSSFLVASSAVTDDRNATNFRKEGREKRTVDLTPTPFGARIRTTSNVVNERRMTGVLAAVLVVAAASGDAQTGDLVRQLTSSDDTTRRETERRLVKMGTNAVKPLAALLGHDNKDVSHAAAWTLRQIGSPAAEALASRLTGPDEAARFPAAYALASITAFRQAEPWLEAVKDRDPRVRYCAVIALANTGDTRAEDALAAALEDKDARVREAAAPALAKLRASRGPGPARQGERVRYHEAMQAWRDGGPAAVSLLIRGLRAGDGKVRQHCAWSLGKLEVREGIEPLIQVVEAQADPQQVHYAVISLTQITGQDFGRNGTKWREWHNRRQAK